MDRFTAPNCPASNDQTSEILPTDMPVVNTIEWLDPTPRAHLLRTEVSEIQLLNSLWLFPAETAMDCLRLEPNIDTGLWTSNPAFLEERESTVADEYEMPDVDDTTIIPVVTIT